MDNLTGMRQSDLSVQAKVYGLDGKLLDDRSANGLALADQGVAQGVLHPTVPAPTVPPEPAKTYMSGLLRQTEIYLAGVRGRRPRVPLNAGRLEAAAKRAMRRDAFAYVAAGAGNERTVLANRTASQ